MSDLDLIFSPEAVARAAGVPVRTVTIWTSSGKVTGLRSSPGRGVRRSFSWYQMIEVAFASEILNRTNLRSVEDAFDAAREFAQNGSVTAFWRDAADAPAPERLPGLPFHPDLGATLLIMTAEGVEVRLVSAPIDPADLPDAALVANAGAIFATICARLGLNARELIERGAAE